MILDWVAQRACPGDVALLDGELQFAVLREARA